METFSYILAMVREVASQTKIERVLWKSSTLFEEKKKNKKYPETNCLRNSNNTIKVSLGQAVLELLIKMCKILFWLITQKQPGLLRF